MSTVDTVADSTDWLGTPLAALSPIENSLRCQVCKDFFVTPMITSCSHTFCSLCIRRYLSQEGRCPACRESDQEVRLRRNWIVEELVAQFTSGRDGMLKFARSRPESNEDEGETRASKRRKLDRSTEVVERRSTRSQSRRVNYNQNDTDVASVEEARHSDNGSVYEDEPEAGRQTLADGLVACPICNRRMKEAHINRHLDSNCQDLGGSPHSPQVAATSAVLSSSLPLSSSSSHNQSRPAAMTTATTREKLPTLNYSMLSDGALRKKLRELGIPNHGSKELMKKRHTEWVNLWNASCDAQTPASIPQLRKDLEQWERTLGRQIDRGPSGVMVKEFDREGWQKTNKNDFDDLIRQARARAAEKKQQQQQQQQQETSQKEMETESNTNPEIETDPVSNSSPDQHHPESIQKIFSPHVAMSNVSIEVSIPPAENDVGAGNVTGLHDETKDGWRVYNNGVVDNNS